MHNPKNCFISFFVIVHFFIDESDNIFVLLRNNSARAFVQQTSFLMNKSLKNNKNTSDVELSIDNILASKIM